MKTKILAFLAVLFGAVSVAQGQGQGQGQPGLAAQVQQLAVQVQGLSGEVQGLTSTVACLSIPTETVYVQLMARGSYSVTGAWYGSINLVGRPIGLGPVRNYYVFDLSVLGEYDLIVGAQLITYNPAGGFASDSTDTLTYMLNRVSTSVTALKNGTAGTVGYLDLADGPVYATYVASTAVNDDQIVISLSDKAIRDIYRSRHSGFGNDFEPYLFAMGGSILELNMGIGVAGNAYFLAFGQNYPLTNTALELNVRHYNPGCPPPTDSQYQ